MDDEIVLRPAWRSQWFTILLLIISISGYLLIYNPWLQLFLSFSICFFILKILARRYGRSYMIGPKGVEVNIGLFYRNMTRIEYRHIRGVNLRQTLFNRLMSIGQILVSTSGMDTELIISDIKRPVYFTDIIKNRLKDLS
jgi:uncharacterized membrane protein YdbT with pleckstrin-like domain